MSTRVSIPKRALAAAIIVSMLFSSMPSVLADDDAASATMLMDGSSGTGSVDAGGDSNDWWRIDLLNGDRVSITVDGSWGSNTGDSCRVFWTDH